MGRNAKDYQHILNILGAPKDGPGWDTFLDYCEMKTILKVFKKGDGAFSFPDLRLEIFFSANLIDSVALYGPESDGCGSKSTGAIFELPSKIRFGETYQDVQAKLGNPVLARKVGRLTSANPPEGEIVKGQHTHPLPIQLISYRLNEYCMTLEFDQAQGDKLLAVEICKYTHFQRVHNLK